MTSKSPSLSHPAVFAAGALAGAALAAALPAPVAAFALAAVALRVGVMFAAAGEAKTLPARRG